MPDVARWLTIISRSLNHPMWRLWAISKLEAISIWDQLQVKHGQTNTQKGIIMCCFYITWQLMDYQLAIKKQHIINFRGSIGPKLARKAPHLWGPAGWCCPGLSIGIHPDDPWPIRRFGEAEIPGRRTKASPVSGKAICAGPGPQDVGDGMRAQLLGRSTLYAIKTWENTGFSHPVFAPIIPWKSAPKSTSGIQFFDGWGWWQ